MKSNLPPDSAPGPPDRFEASNGRNGNNRRLSPWPEFWLKMMPVILAGAVTLIGAVVAGIVTVRSIKSEVVATHEAVKEQAEEVEASDLVRDGKIQEIHVLVNSRLTVVLRMLVRVTKKEADRTKDPEDIRVYQEALAELQRAEAATAIVAGDKPAGADP